MQAVCLGFVTNSSSTVYAIYWKPFKQFDRSELVDKIWKRIEQTPIEKLLCDHGLADEEEIECYWTKEELEEAKDALFEMLRKLNRSDIVMFDSCESYADVVATILPSIAREILEDSLELEDHDIPSIC